MEPVVFALIGAAIILAYWLPRWISPRDPVATPLLIVAGLSLGLLMPRLSYQLNPLGDAEEWTLAAEVTVIISLFGAGLMIDNWNNKRAWMPAVRLLVIAMPLTIGALALLGWWAAGLSLAAAVLLGAVMAPTDPVLAGGVQVGKPLEGGEDPARLTLATEAGLNDGLAFPFVHLALMVAAAGNVVSGALLGEWALDRVVIKIAVGLLSGLGIGWLLGKILFDWPRRNPLAQTEAGIVAFAAVLLTYGVTELLHGYGFIAAFIAGIVVRQSERHHRFNRTLHGFTESVELMLTALILLALGISLPQLWPWMDWISLGIAAALVLLIRPAAGFLSLSGVKVRNRERAVMAMYGIRGVGSIYYVAYAFGKQDFGDEGRIWAIVALSIILSTLVHGLTGELAVERASEGAEHDLGGDAVAMKSHGEDKQTSSS